MLKLVAILAGLVLSATAADAGGYRPPRTPSGSPDLQGVWSNETLTRLQRPERFKSLVATAAEAATREQEASAGYAEALAPVRPDAPAPADSKVGQDAEQWFGPPPGMTRIRGEVRTSLLVDPAH